MISLNILTPKKKIINVILTFFILSISGCLMVLVRTLVTLNSYYVFLIWNLFLAWIPLFLSLVLIVAGLHKIIKMLIWLSWIVFYPNASYFITDFIHIKGSGYHMSSESGIDLVVWYDFLMISLFVLTGVLIGFLSLYLLHRLIEKNFGNRTGWRFVILVELLSSYGIYLGRFIRLNSWHIVTMPAVLMKSILSSFNMETFLFILILSFFLTLIYIALYNIAHLDK